MKFSLLNELMDNGMTEDVREALSEASAWELIDLIEQLHLMCTDVDAFDDLMVNGG